MERRRSSSESAEAVESEHVKPREDTLDEEMQAIGRVTPGAADKDLAEDDVDFQDTILPNVAPVSIEWNNITLKAPTKKWFGLRKTGMLTILHGLCGSARPGRLLAILGSGKTSLLNVLSGRVQEGEISGEVSLNDEVLRNTNDVKRVAGYVTQHDYLFPNLTVRETLTYAAMLRLPPTLTRQEKLMKVEAVLSELRLRACADTRVGGEWVRGISGGERRRVSIGVQLLTNPSLLFLDEPTTGLDSTTAHSIIETLKKVANRNRTVICTVHQPRSDIVGLFDDLMLLSRGRVAYFGPSNCLVPYLRHVGYPCPVYANPADFAMDTITVDTKNEKTEKKTTKRLMKIVRRYQKLVIGRESLGINSEDVKAAAKAEETETNSATSSPRLQGSEVSIHEEGEEKKREKAERKDKEAKREKQKRHKSDKKEKTEKKDKREKTHKSERKSKDEKEEKKQNKERNREKKTRESNTERETATTDDTSPEKASESRTTLDQPVDPPLKWRKHRKQAPLLPATLALFSRSLTNLRRTIPSLSARTFNLSAMAILLVIFVFRLDLSQYGWQNRIGLLYEAMIGPVFVGMLNGVALFPPERDIFHLEYLDGVYPGSAFFLAYAAVKVIFDVLACFIFSCLFYFVLGLQSGADKFFYFVLCQFLLISLGEIIACVLCCIFRDANVANTYSSVLISVVTFLGGFFRSAKGFPIFFQWLNYTLSFRAACAVVMINEYTGLVFTCDDPSSCRFTRGEQVLEVMDFTHPFSEYLWSAIGLTGAYWAIFCAAVLLSVPSARARWVRAGKKPIP